MYRHIVLFKLRADTSEETRIEALRVLEELGHSHPGIVQWIVTPSLDTRKGEIIIEDATFTDADSFEDFRSSDRHQQAAQFMSQIADWTVGDYLERFTTSDSGSVSRR